MDRGNVTDADLRESMRELTAAERVREAVHLSEFLTGVAQRTGLRRLSADLLLSALARHQVEFVVIGGFALAPHGYVRATDNLDIMPSPDPDNQTRLAAALVELDARIEGAEGELSTRFGHLDVMQDVPGLRDYAHLRTGAIEVDGVLFAGFDELVGMKAAAGRDEDRRDIAAIQRARELG